MACTRCWTASARRSTSTSTRWRNASSSWAGRPWGTTQTTAKSTTLPAYPTDIYAVTDHLHALIECYGKAANNVRAAIEQVDEAGDADTADIFTEVSRGLDKSLWFLEAHVQE